MTSNTASLPDCVKEYLALRQHENALKDQINGIRKRMQALTPEVSKVVQSTTNQNIPVIPLPHEFEMLGNVGGIRLVTSNTFVNWSKPLLYRLTHDFMKMWLNTVDHSLIDAITDSYVRFVWEKREKKVSHRLERFYADTKMKTLHAKRKKPNEPARAKDKKFPKQAKNAIETDAQVFTGQLPQMLPHMIQNLKVLP